MTEDKLTVGERRILGAILILVIVLVSADLLTDSREGVHWLHLIVELSIGIAAGVGFILLIRESFHKSHELGFSKEVIIAKEKETEKWRAESKKYAEGLSQAIDSQLARWNLSQSEKDIALLLLKGLSIKEIAVIRNTNEKTVRAQSVAIYSKSGLSGRSELAAFFLEDLLVPAAPALDKDIQNTAK